MAVRVGVIGGGVYGTNLLNSFSELSREGLAELVAIADIDQTKVNEHKENFGIRGYTEYREMLDKEDLDAVAVATPDHLHKDITIEVANAGKHILLQKPMDVTEEGCWAMIEAARKNNILLEVDFHKRFDPAHRKLREAVKSGDLGQIQYGYAWIEDILSVPTDMLKSWSASSSSSWFVGVHYYDLMAWVIGSKPSKVYATGAKGKLIGLGFNTFDSIQAKVEFENGANIVFDSSWIIPNHFPAWNNQGCKLVGTEGIWEIDAQDRGVWFCDRNGLKSPNYYFLREEKDALGRSIHAGYGADAHREFIIHANLTKEGKPIPKGQTTLFESAEEGVESTRIALAVDESIATGEVIKLKN